MACPPGMYSSNGQCVVCSTNCSQCTGTSTNCINCPLAKYWLNGVCYTDCPNGYYESVTMTCVPCMSLCLTCTSATSCTSCVSGYSIYSTVKFYSSCPSSQYMLSDGNCGNCSVACASCYGSYPDQCTSCKSPLVLYRGVCYTVCPASTYLNGV